MEKVNTLKNLENGVKIVKGQVLNPNGRPRKTLGSLAKELTEKGYKNVSKSEIIDTLAFMLNLDKEAIGFIVNDSESPMFARIFAKAILDPKKGVDILNTIVDRVIGKPKQTSEVEINATIETKPVDFAKLSEIEIRTLLEATSKLVKPELGHE